MTVSDASGSGASRRDLGTLALACLFFASVVSGLWACGEDLAFPGQVPPTGTPTPTEEATDTPDPDDEDE